MGDMDWRRSSGFLCNFNSVRVMCILFGCGFLNSCFGAFGKNQKLIYLIRELTNLLIVLK